MLDYLRPGDLLVGNNSRVIPARLHGVKETGGAVEIFLLRPHEAGAWECLVGGKGLRPGVRGTCSVLRLRPHCPQSKEGRILSGAVEDHAITATILAETPTGGRIIRFDPPVDEWLWDLGETPLPPYIHEPLADAERYQTVYSRIEGSVASSTAGLHFTPEMLMGLRERGVRFAAVTLHIGLDTFKPVQAENIEEHRIHREWAELPPDTARAVNETRLGGGRIIAIGTTVVRTLESAAKIALGFKPCDEVPEGSVCGWQTVAAFSGRDRPLHPPRPPLPCGGRDDHQLPPPPLHPADAGQRVAGKNLIDRAYAEAIRERYRFYSFGDAMAIF